MVAGVQLPLRMGVAVCLLPALQTVDAVVQPLETCAMQRGCVEWTMEKSTTGCTDANRVIADGKKTCPGMWKVCMKIHKHDAQHAACPEAMVRSICPNDVCPKNGALPDYAVAQKAPNNCGTPFIVSGQYCQYGKPGDFVKFFVSDGANDCTAQAADSTEVPPSWASPNSIVQNCSPQVSCRVATPADGACRSGCGGVAGPKPCVHTFYIPPQCACEAVPGDGGNHGGGGNNGHGGGQGGIESMPPQMGDSTGGLLAASGNGRASTSTSSALAMLSVLCVASAAAVGAIVYRRLAPTPIAENARDMELLEVGLTE